jgi:phosphonate transport system substrate-binding protein
MHPGQFHRFIVGLLALSTLWMTQALAEQVFKVAIVPFMAPTAINHSWTPVLARLEKVTGHRFELRVYDQFAQFENDFQAGVPDFIYVNPYHEVMAKQAQGYLPLVRDNSKQLKAILVVRADGPIHLVSELGGKTVSFASPNAFAPLYLRALLTEKEKVTIHPVFVSSPQNAYRHVLTGDAAAGGGILPLLQKEPAAVQARLRVLYTTPGVAGHPLAAHPRVPEAIRHQVQQAIIDMAHDPKTQKLLNVVLMEQPIAADYVRDYAPLELLHFERYMTRSPN